MGSRSAREFRRLPEYQKLAHEVGEQLYTVSRIGQANDQYIYTLASEAGSLERLSVATYKLAKMIRDELKKDTVSTTSIIEAPCQDLYFHKRRREV